MVDRAAVIVLLCILFLIHSTQMPLSWACQKLRIRGSADLIVTTLTLVTLFSQSPSGSADLQFQTDLSCVYICVYCALLTGFVAC